MRIALCFSGQPRFVSEVSQLIKANVIGEYDVDVFAHLWFDEDLQTKPYKYGGDGGWKDQRIFQCHRRIQTNLRTKKTFG